MNNKKAILAPIMGGMISVFIFVLYLMATVNYQDNSILNVVFSLLKIIPVVSIVFIAISYVVCLVIGLPLIYFKNKNLLSLNVFLFLSLTIGSILGMLIGIVSYEVEKNIAKSLAILLSFSFGSLFSASLYSVLNGEIKPK